MNYINTFPEIVTGKTRCGTDFCLFPVEFLISFTLIVESNEILLRKFGIDELILFFITWKNKDLKAPVMFVELV